jgi:glycosyltransferase involved in cell wall biosynthesis
VICGLTTDCALVDPRSDPFEWGRFNAFDWDTSTTLAAKLDGWYTWAAKLKRSILRANRRTAVSAGRLTAKSRSTLAESHMLETSRGPSSAELTRRVASASVVNLVNILSPYDRQIYAALAERVGKLTILVSSPLGLHGIEKSDWSSLDVRLQRTWTLHRPQHHPLKFHEDVDIHIPWDTLSQLTQLKPDVIITHETGFRSLFSALYARKRSRPPLILWIAMTDHTERGRGWARHLLRRWLLRQAEIVAVNGPATARYVARLGVEPERVVCIPYIALPGASAHGPATRDPSIAYRLLYVGQFVERKGLIPFMYALARWATAHPTRQVEFSLIGSGPLEAAIRAMAMPDNVNIRLPGRSSPATMGECYARAGIFVLPTLADEWGLVVNEAMASALPVLGSRYSQAVDELCEDGKTGWTFRPDAPGEMERALDAALNTPLELLEAMRAAAQDRVKHLTVDFAVQRLVETIGMVLERANRPASAGSKS